MDQIFIAPIGVVRRDSGEPSRDETVRLVVDEEHVAGLACIEEADKLLVLFWLDRVAPSNRRAGVCHPYGDESLEERGVFALRAPMRPNPVGATVVDLIKRDGDTLYVRGLDALDGSPLIDIKSSGPIPGTGRS